MPCCNNNYNNNNCCPDKINTVFTPGTLSQIGVTSIVTGGGDPAETVYLASKQFLDTTNNTAVPTDLVITISSTEQTNTVQLKGPSLLAGGNPASLTLDNKSGILTRCPLKTVSVCITSELIGKVSYWSRNVGVAIVAAADSISKELNNNLTTSNTNLICYAPGPATDGALRINAGVAGQAGSLNYSCDVVLPVSINQFVTFTAKSQAFSTGITSPTVTGGPGDQTAAILAVQYISATFQLEGTIIKTGSNTYSVNVVQSIPNVEPTPP